MRSIDKLHTVNQVAATFGVAPSSIWRWVKQGVLPEPVKVGGRTRWVEAEIRPVIERGKAARAKKTRAEKRARVRLDDV
jgi:prophage regulatory protein